MERSLGCVFGCRAKDWSGLASGIGERNSTEPRPDSPGAREPRKACRPLCFVPPIGGEKWGGRGAQINILLIGQKHPFDDGDAFFELGFGHDERRGETDDVAVRGLGEESAVFELDT